MAAEAVFEASRYSGRYFPPNPPVSFLARFDLFPDVRHCRLDFLFRFGFQADQIVARLSNPDQFINLGLERSIAAILGILN